MKNIPHGQVALAWDHTRDSTLIDDFVEMAPAALHQ
jgi:hypothetical protein